MGIQLPGTTEIQRTAFEQYLSLLFKWNKTHNLTAIRNVDDVVKRHFLESISLIPHLGSAQTILDLGTGAGFPGLPIAIMCPHLHVTVLDSAHKKIAFCQEAIRTCHLQNATAILANANDPSTPLKIGKFEAIVSRATWALADYIPVALCYVQSPNGIILAMKGPRHQAELNVTPPLPTTVHGPEIRTLSTGGIIPQDLIVIKYWTD